MNKKADIEIGWEFIVRLIIALVLAFSACAIATKFFRLSDEAQESYSNLITFIEDLDPGELKSQPIRLDKQTALLGFEPNSTEIKIYYNVEWGAVSRKFVFQRLPACKTDKSCLCLCTEFERTDAVLNTGYFDCKKAMCRNFDNLIFVDEMCTPEQEDCVLEVDNGFAAVRAIKYGWSQTLASTKDPRIRTIYAQNYKGTTYLCWNSPCISEEMKKEIDAQT
jgi:hypothetical protein